MRRILTISVIAVTLLLTIAGVQTPARSSIYYPPAGDTWQRKQPADAGFNAALLEQAVAFARTQESKMPRDFSTQVQTFGALLGPLPKERGETNGIILRHGYIIAEWGDTRRIDPTYSIAKSFLSTVLGLTIDRAMIKSIDDPVRDYVKDGGYDSPHNSKITWRHHATQTSEWEGSMFGKSHDFIGHRAVWRRPPTASRAERARPVLGIQRRAHQSLFAIAASSVEASAARSDQAIRYGPDWSFNNVGVSRVQQLGRDDRRQEDDFGERRHALGRRLVDQHARRGSIRISLPAARQVEQQTDCFGEVGSDGYSPCRSRARLRISLVA